jgi:uncharacterized protein
VTVCRTGDPRGLGSVKAQLAPFICDGHLAHQACLINGNRNASRCVLGSFLIFTTLRRCKMRRMPNGGANQPFAVKRTITGLGLIALKGIPKGKRIIEYFGPLITNEEVERKNGLYFFGINKKWSIDGSVRHNLARYINHSCKPNAEAIVSQRGRVWIFAIKNIKSGEEITYDYGEEYFDGVIKPHGCRCVSCRPGRSRKKPPKNKRIG